ncbi:hypothetical protein RND81_12G052700 [Saponaria officinalis]|uniref:CCHC-type domain-containing protein n=1 Tax=Saponaria officinalis TaxID=3572 RepID=A0AAW1H5Y7_SAPOF
MLPTSGLSSHGSLARQQKKKMNESESDSNSESGDDTRSKKDQRKDDDDRSLKLDIPEFNGEGNAEKFLDWIRQTERIFDYKDYDERKKFKVAPLKLTKYASLWLALKFEKQDKSKRTYNRDYTRSSSTSSKPVATTSSSKETRKEDPKDKGRNTVVEVKETRLRRCFKCQGYGHIASECLQKRALTIQELINLVPNFVAPELESEPINVENESDEEEVHEVEPYSDEEKEALVLRTLHTEAAPAENEQRERLFHSRCKVNDRINTLIVDSGSCTNVIARDVVAKLKIPTKDHPKPYRLHWLDGNNGVMVKKQALVSLQLGPYEVEILCDVIPMNAWKAKYRLKPLSPTQRYRPLMRDSLFLEANEAEEVVVRGEPTYLLLVREIVCEGSRSESVCGLLDEFADVFPEELPNGLPPKRGIEHQIDLIPGAALPNKPAYRCNPEEAKELQ